MGPTSAAKDDLRRLLLEQRRRRDPDALEAVGTALAAHASAAVALSGARSVAAYLAMRGEPPTGALLAQLHGRGATVLVPLTRPDGTLDWARHVEEAATTRSTMGIPEPSAPQVRAEGLQGLDLVLVPALAVDHHGRRLGRGAGYYDRALADLAAPRPLLCAVVFADELLPEVPHEPHDVPVDLVLTEAGVFRPER